MGRAEYVYGGRVATRPTFNIRGWWQALNKCTKSQMRPLAPSHGGLLFQIHDAANHREPRDGLAGEEIGAVRTLV